MSTYMRIRDLKWKQLAAWPPEWALPNQGVGEVGVLKLVKIRNNRSPEYIYIEADHQGQTLWGITLLEDPRHLDSLYRTLSQNVGKPLAEIGDLEIPLPDRSPRGSPGARP